MNHSSQRRPAGFTLVELLVVISITMLLIALLMPMLRQAKRQSKNIQCYIYLRQLGQLEFMYAMDYKDCIAGMKWIGASGAVESNQLVNAVDGKGNPIKIGTAGNGSWLYPGASHQSLFNRLGYLSGYIWCPDMTNQGILESYTTFKDQVRPQYDIAYDLERHAPDYTYGTTGYIQAMRVTYSTAVLSGECNHLQRLSSLSSKHVLFGERHMRANNWGVGYGYAVNADEYVAYQVGFRHLGSAPTANFLLMDDHVESWNSLTWSAYGLAYATSEMVMPK